MRHVHRLALALAAPLACTGVGDREVAGQAVRTSGPYLSVVAFGLAVILAACGGGAKDETTLRSPDGSAELVVPAGALPEGISAGDISIEIVEADTVLGDPARFDPHAFPGRSLEDSVPLAPDDVVAAVRLEPAGLEFTEPVRLRLPMPEGESGALLAMMISPEREQPIAIAAHEPVTEASGAGDDTPRVVELSVPHFSVVALLRIEPFSGLLTPMRVTREVGESVEFIATFARQPQRVFRGVVSDDVSFVLELSDEWSIADGSLVSTGHELDPDIASLKFTSPSVTGAGPYEGRASLRCERLGRWFSVKLEGSVRVRGLLIMARPHRDGTPFTSGIGDTPFDIEVENAARVECVEERSGFEDDDGSSTAGGSAADGGGSKTLYVVGGGQWIQLLPPEPSAVDQLVGELAAWEAKRQSRKWDGARDSGLLSVLLERLHEADETPADHQVVPGEETNPEAFPAVDIRGVGAGFAPNTFFNPTGLDITGPDCGGSEPDAGVRAICPFGAAVELDADRLVVTAIQLDGSVPVSSDDYLQYVVSFDVDGDPASGYVPPVDAPGDIITGADVSYDLYHDPQSGWQFARWDRSMMPQPTTGRAVVSGNFVFFALDPAEVQAPDGSVRFRVAASADPGDDSASDAGAADIFPEQLPAVSGTPAPGFVQLVPYTVACDAGNSRWAEGLAEVQANGDLLDPAIGKVVGRDGEVDEDLACAAHGYGE